MGGNNLLMILAICLLVIGSATAFTCVYQEDNSEVKDFKYKMNLQALDNDVKENGLTEEGLNIKIKYFTKCD